MSAKGPDGIRKWGIVDIIIPEKVCDVDVIDLSSTDVVNEYRQLLLQEKGIQVFGWNIPTQPGNIMLLTWEILFVLGQSYNRNLLLKVPEELPQFNVIDDDFEIFDKNLIGAPCNKIQQ